MVGTAPFHAVSFGLRRVALTRLTPLLRQLLEPFLIARTLPDATLVMNGVDGRYRTRTVGQTFALHFHLVVEHILPTLLLFFLYHLPTAITTFNITTSVPHPPIPRRTRHAPATCPSLHIADVACSCHSARTPPAYHHLVVAYVPVAFMQHACAGGYILRVSPTRGYDWTVPLRTLYLLLFSAAANVFHCYQSGSHNHHTVTAL